MIICQAHRIGPLYFLSVLRGSGASLPGKATERTVARRAQRVTRSSVARSANCVRSGPPRLVFFLFRIVSMSRSSQSDRSRESRGGGGVGGARRRWGAATSPGGRLSSRQRGAGGRRRRQRGGRRRLGFRSNYNEPEDMATQRYKITERQISILLWK
jgi:hypothetical protein